MYMSSDHERSAQSSLPKFTKKETGIRHLPYVSSALYNSTTPGAIYRLVVSDSAGCYPHNDTPQFALLHGKD